MSSPPPLFVSSSSRLDVDSSQANYLAEHTEQIDLNGGSSPVRYSSSDVSRNLASSSILGNSSSQLLASQRRGDIYSSDVRGPRSDRGGVSIGEPSARDNFLTSVGGEQVRVIWGTNVSVEPTKEAFREFLRHFREQHRTTHKGGLALPGEGEELVYKEKIKEMYRIGSRNLNLDASDLQAYPPAAKIYHQLILYPQEIIPIMDMVVKEYLLDLLRAPSEREDLGNPTRQDMIETEQAMYSTRPYNVGESKNLRDLNPKDIDKLISIKGLVIRSTPVIPDMREAFFRCNVCNHATIVGIERGLIKEPTMCDRKECSQKHCMQLIHNRCTFADRQVVRIQETPDATPAGQTPHSVSFCAYDELVDVCRPGDRVLITGIYRSIPKRINPRQRTVRSLYRTYVDAIHIQKIDSKRMGTDVAALEGKEDDPIDVDDEMDHDHQDESYTNQNLEATVARAETEETRRITPLDVKRIREVAAREDVYDLLAHSVAPSVFENTDVKKGILLQLFGGTHKTFEKSGSPRFRGDINVLLCGDPSTSKSQILSYVHRIAPRGCYTSGKGSSAVGLTAYVTRDPETRQLVLESGALVLSDGGVCCIDEFDKMSDSTRSVLHEVMEQQTISVAKAGIITTLNARTSILASANPIGSKYDPRLSVTQNIDLPPSLLSRFDLVYLMIDKIDERMDRKLASHITSMYMEDEVSGPEAGQAMEDYAEEDGEVAPVVIEYNAEVSLEDAKVLPLEFLTLYISYAREHCRPKLTVEAKNELVKAYVAMRSLGKDPRGAENRITATTRQLESMIRLAEAHAKMRLAKDVTVDDALEAVRLMRSAIKEYAMDPVTGIIDMDLVQTGTSAMQRRLRSSLAEHILAVLENSPSPNMPFIELVRLLRLETARPVENLDIGDALRALASEDKIAVSGEGNSRQIRRLTS